MLKLPKNEGLNIVPFIDIMLVLLAIILSISTFIAHGKIEINLPVSENALSLNNDEKKLSISIDENNIFYLDDKTTDLKGLSDAISSLHKKTIVELKSDKNAKFESFVQIIDLLKAKEHENFQ
ncbi:TPA: TonB system transport protein ExbD, partial [Campylobacter coli]|nr:TonB system transport protein ExbD [Campylobacter coli]EIT5563479.1 TonB system transport protein ExbD [Campylobacter coli]EKE4926259.1 TonB system transport protein ExbD [Campylobacter coli]